MNSFLPPMIKMSRGMMARGQIRSTNLLLSNNSIREIKISKISVHVLNQRTISRKKAKPSLNNPNNKTPPTSMKIMIS